eukprot:c19404_g1_i2 orf=739-1182(+)
MAIVMKNPWICPSVQQLWQWHFSAMRTPRLIIFFSLCTLLHFCFVSAFASSHPVFSEQFYTGGHITEHESRQLEEQQQLHLEDFYHNGKGRITVEEDPDLEFDNDRLRDAFIAFQAWKRAIFSDPFNVTGTWVGPDVCSYKGVFCEE